MKRQKTNTIPDAINCSNTQEYTQVPNTLLRNPALSCKAKGLLCILLSNRQGWQTHVQTLQNLSTDGRDGIASGLRELEEHNYLRRVRYRDPATKQWTGTLWAYTDTPGEFNYAAHPELSPQEELDPQTEKPLPETPRTENPPVNNINIKKTKESIHSRAHEEYEEFMSQLPKAWDQNKDFKIVLNNFIRHRHEKHKPLTHQAIKALTNKLKSYPVDIARDALHKSIESGWTGVFPESVKDSTPSQRQPDQILEQHPALQPIYTEALATLTVAHNGDAQRLAHRLVEMHRFITTHQSPEVRTNRQVPTPVMLMRDYAEWLGEQQWMDSVTPNTYDPGGRSFTRFLRDTCDSTGLNVFTGERV